MAPNKKKKKPASNPARGFATTSTASKTKEQDVDEVEQEDGWGASGQSAKLVSEEGSVLTNGGPTIKPEKALQDLSPEELELQLENSSLQILVDTYRKKTEKDAFRQASRLQTERRVLRSQAEHLSTRTGCQLKYCSSSQISSTCRPSPITGSKLELVPMVLL